jgi:hypothetical protein
MTCKAFLASAALVMSLLAAAPVQAASILDYQYTFTGQDPNGVDYNAFLSVIEQGGIALSGTGLLSGAGLATPQDLTLITASTPGVENPLGYRANDGTDLFGVDTVIPIDANGLLFSVGPNAPAPGADALFSVWDNGGGNFQSAFAGTPPGGSYWYVYGTADETSLIVTAVPELGTWALLLAGLFGVGVMLRLVRRRALA